MKKHSVTITSASQHCIKIWLLTFCFVWLVFFLGIEGRAVPVKKRWQKAQKPACAYSRIFYRILLLNISHGVI